MRLQELYKVYHALALVCVGQASAHGTEVVRHVRRVRCAGDDGRDPLISEQIFEKELRPAVRKVFGPVRNLLAPHGAEQPTAPQWLGC